MRFIPSPSFALWTIAPFCCKLHKLVGHKLTAREGRDNI